MKKPNNSNGDKTKNSNYDKNQLLTKKPSGKSNMTPQQPMRCTRASLRDLAMFYERLDYPLRHVQT